MWFSDGGLQSVGGAASDISLMGLGNDTALLGDGDLNCY
jgi:hypothetical protein